MKIKKYKIIGLATSLFCMQSLYAQHAILGWDRSTDPTISSYNIYRAIHKDSSFLLLATVNHPVNTYMDEKMQWDVHYYYVATSVDKFGLESGFSNKIDTTLQSPVPVELYSFYAQVDNSKNIVLNWSTAAESNNYGFQVQRLCDGAPGQFETIGFVKGNGTATDSQNYRFVDKNVPAGTYFYRLKQIDFDGSYKFSDTIKITLVLPAEVHLFQNYPNPFNRSTEIAYNLPMNGHVVLNIYDEMGHEIICLVDQFQIKGKYTVTWNATDVLGKEVSSGQYYYKITTDSFSAWRKMMLVK
ncbi:T9SS type A sorting domain-containing protein [candidate division KSB1 bacterium]|nr:T9SS type A sorting domain-containing protein [candidate division KSB1 bacterium]